MNILELIQSRTSYRGSYRPDPVPREDLRRIMEAGLAAPSGCNKQTTSLIGVDDPALLAELLAAIDPPVAQTAPAAVCVLTQRICATCRTIRRLLKICCWPFRPWAMPAAGMRGTSQTRIGLAAGWQTFWACRRNTSWFAFCP